MHSSIFLLFVNLYISSSPYRTQAWSETHRNEWKVSHWSSESYGSKISCWFYAELCYSSVLGSLLFKISGFVYVSHAMGKQNEKCGTYNRTFLASRAWASRLTWETLRRERFHVFRRKPTHPTINQNSFSTCAHTQKHQVTNIHCGNRTVRPIKFTSKTHWSLIRWCVLPCQLQISIGKYQFHLNSFRLYFSRECA